MSEQDVIQAVERELLENDNPTIFRCSEQLDKLFAAMSKAQGAMIGAKKEANNPYFKSTYADMHSIIEASRKALLDQGLCVIQTMGIGRQSVYLLTTLGHSSGQWIQSKTPILYEKGNNHSFGSGLTYARRYSWLAIAGLAPMDSTDDDGNASIDTSQQMNPEPINHQLVEQTVKDLRLIIDQDKLDEMNSEIVKKLWSKLSNDERLAVNNKLGFKAKDSKKMYRRILKEYLDYHPANDMML